MPKDLSSPLFLFGRAREKWFRKCPITRRGNSCIRPDFPFRSSATPRQEGRSGVARVEWHFSRVMIYSPPAGWQCAWHLNTPGTRVRGRTRGCVRSTWRELPFTPSPQSAFTSVALIAGSSRIVDAHLGNWFPVSHRVTSYFCARSIISTRARRSMQADWRGSRNELTNVTLRPPNSFVVFFCWQFRGVYNYSKSHRGADIEFIFVSVVCCI